MAISTGIIFAFILIKNRKKGLGVKHNIILAVLGAVMCVLLAVMLTLIQFDSHITNKTLIKIVCLTAIGSFFVFMITLIVYCANYIDKVNKR